MWRVLKAGGVLVIEEPNIRRLLVRVVAMAERLALMRSRFRDPTWIAGRLSSIGAQVSIHQEGYTVWVVAEKPIP